MEIKKVSVVVPCYNYAHYLGECLDSLMYQTYKNIEIIVVNDGGKDNVKEVTDKYPSVILIEKVNGGLSSARNVGIARATGEYIMCLDADDKLVPAGIEEHVNLMDNDMAIAQCTLMEFGDRHTIMVPTDPTSLKQVLRGNTIFCNAMFAKKVWVAIGGYDESEIMRWGWEDYEFWIRCLEYGCHVNTSTFIALRYRFHEGQMTQATTRPHWEDLKKYLRTKHRHLYEKEGIEIEDIYK
jgi:glycosyltransferase involved in cell wall biosynthesis